MKVLVTGGAGLIGSWVAKDLRKHHQVVIADDLSGGDQRNIPDGCEFLCLDLRDRDSAAVAVRGCEIVYHLAAYAAEGQSVFSPAAIGESNITTTNALLVASVNAGIRRFVFASSMAVYGDQLPPFDETMPVKPVDPYGAGKAYCEAILPVFGSVHGLEWTVVRPHNVYGPHQNLADPYRNVLGIWMNRILRNLPPLIYGDGGQRRAFSYVDGVAKAIVRAGLLPSASGEVVNIGSGDVVSIKDACDLVLDVMQSDLKPVHAPDRPCEVRDAWCTTEKSVIVLDYHETVELREGVTRMAQWAMERGPTPPSWRVPLEIDRGAPDVWRERTM